MCVLISACSAPSSATPDLEKTVCGALKEPLVFWMWHRAAGNPAPSNIEMVANARAIDYLTVDGRRLRGYHLRQTAKDGVRRGSLLLAQGNAMLADQLLSFASTISEAGIDVYVFDYRGYGQSEGKRRLNAIVADYQALYRHFLPLDEPRLLYGISFGGIVVANLIGSGIHYDGAVIDSSPSRLSNHGCSVAFYPVIHIPDDASKILMIAGERDHVVKPADTRELREAIEKHGGTVVFRNDFAHPFMDRAIATRIARIELIQQHLVTAATSSITKSSQGR